MFKAFDCFGADASEVGFLGEDTTDQTDGVLDGTFFPAVVRFAEVGFGSQDSIDFQVVKILVTVIIGNGSSSVLGITG